MFWFARCAPVPPDWIDRLGLSARQGEHFQWELEWPRELGWSRLVQTLDDESRAWLAVDPLGHLDGCTSTGGVWTFAPRSTDDIAGCVRTASRGFGGALVVDVAGCAGLWGRRGPQCLLWRRLRSVSRGKMPVVDLALAPSSSPTSDPSHSCGQGARSPLTAQVSTQHAERPW